MKVDTWSTRTPLPAAFADSWRTVMDASRHSHFALELAYLKREAEGGHHALLVVAEEGEVMTAAALREGPLGWNSGWPWRWQVASTGPGDATARGFDDRDARRLFDALSRLSGWRRLEIHLPFEGPPGVRARRAGATILLPLVGDDETLLRGMDANKRRALKKAAKAGFEIVEASSHGEFRAFQTVQHQTEWRRASGGGDVGKVPSDGPLPPPGESWREWDLPWMWLLVAKREGEVLAGSGFGCSSGGVVDYRANASTLAAKKDNANALLAWEAVRRARDRGYAFLNWGGATEFKRELGGELLPIWTWLGGGALWSLPNSISAGLDHARPQIAAALNRIRGIRAKR